MAQKGFPAPQVELTEEDRQVLERWARRRKTSQALAQRARIVLSAAEGKTSSEIARQLGIGRDTVGRWRKRFVAGGVEALLDEPRCGAPRTIGDEDVERVVRMTLEERPKNSTHWSTRSMAEASGMTQTAVVRIWKAFGLQPHRSSTFKLSTDPQFIEEVRLRGGRTITCGMERRRSSRHSTLRRGGSLASFSGATALKNSRRSFVRSRSKCQRTSTCT